jgi:hypothetical protein
MAKLKLHVAIRRLQGSLDGLVVKNTPHGQVLSRRPDMSNVKWSPAQLAHRKLMQAASEHYRNLMADPGQAARSIAGARRKNIPVSSFVMGEFLRRARQDAALARVQR